MSAVKNIMQRDVITVTPELTLRDLVAVLIERGVSGAPVVANGKVIGVVSATDILEYGDQTPGVPAAREVPTDEAESTGEWNADGGSSPASEFFSEMWEPSEVDALQRMNTAHTPEWDWLAEHTVADIMTRGIVRQPSDTSIEAAAEHMLHANVHRILVVDDGELQGIVTTMDIVKAVASGELCQ